MAYLTQMSLMKENKILHLGHFVLITTGMTFQSKQQNNATLTYCKLCPQNKLQHNSNRNSSIFIEKMLSAIYPSNWPDLAKLARADPLAQPQPLTHDILTRVLKWNKL